MRHSRHVCVTASVDGMSFHAPDSSGRRRHIVCLGQPRVPHLNGGRRARRNGNPLKGTRIHAHTAYLTFVGLDESGTPQPAPPVLPETDAERRRYEAAGMRRQARLEAREKIDALQQR